MLLSTDQAPSQDLLMPISIVFMFITCYLIQRYEGHV
jgi:hypothetical protein